MSDPAKIIATVLVGAEGAADINGAPWTRPATDEEKAAFIQFSYGGNEEIYRRSLVDGTGRPYYLFTVFDNAPEVVQIKARSYCSCLCGQLMEDSGRQESSMVMTYRQ